MIKPVLHPSAVNIPLTPHRLILAVLRSLICTLFYHRINHCI